MTRPDFKRGPDCPAIEALLAPQNEEVRAHLVTCPACRAEAELLNAFDEAQPTHSERADLDWLASKLADVRPSLPPKRRWWQIALGPRLAVAAAALLVVVAVGVQLRTSQVRSLDGSGSSAPVVRSAGSIEWLNATSGEIRSLPTALQWTPVEGSTYTVELLEVDGTVAWKSDALQQPSLALAPPATSSVQPQRTFAWRVTARDGAGRVVAESPRLSFRIAAPAKP